MVLRLSVLRLVAERWCGTLQVIRQCSMMVAEKQPPESPERASESLRMAIRHCSMMMAEKQPPESPERAAEHLRMVYGKAKTALEANPQSVYRHVNPRGVFANNELNLHHINTYGFDYDYTLAVYKRQLNELVYKLALRRLVDEMKYPKDLLSVDYDINFAIRGLHYDVANCCLLKIDAFNQIQRGTVHRGRRRLTNAQIRDLYGGYSVPESRRRVDFPQLIDLFSLPWAGLLATIVEYFDAQRISFDPLPLYEDVKAVFQLVHSTGEMYNHVMNDLETYIHKNDGLGAYLNRLIGNGKELFMITNSPYQFVNAGMKYMLGDDWRSLFKYIVVRAKKPSFFQSSNPFRLLNEQLDTFSFERIEKLESGRIYAGGNINSFSTKAKFRKPGVLYFGDHIYSDLAEPMLRLGWNTAAIVPELASEVRLQNTAAFQKAAVWLQTLTYLIEDYQCYATRHGGDCQTTIREWAAERKQVGEFLRNTFNPNFGSMFRTYHSMSFFYRRLSRLSDIYTSRLPNLAQFMDDRTFFPRRHALSHEVNNELAPGFIDAL